ncbi:MAG TPA: GNAT family N-acetyltransferase [Cytophagales bacterium]|nr:GNAT family N-acetyltransferase [Cytophagales bacterium]HAA23178.1 GNAT family N-acetyltransferase [Cytophagales bacterium]HAP59083.1 GNAT family N-acetyltransferase [Cytophagales bacterium]
MTYPIQTVSTADYPAITEVWEASVRATHHFLTEENIQYFKPLILEQYLDAVELRCIKDEEGNLLAFSGVAEGNLEMLFVHPGSFGQGLGKQLLQVAIQNLGVSKVDVNEQNPQAVGFYQKQGFAVVSRSEKDGTGKPYPILHMELKD